MDVDVRIFLPDELDGWAKIPSPFVGGHSFNLAKKEEAAEGWVDDKAKVFSLSCFCVEKIVVDLDFSLEVEGKVENGEGLGMHFVCRGTIRALTDGFE